MLVFSGKRLGWLLKAVFWGSRLVLSGSLCRYQFSEPIK